MTVYGYAGDYRAIDVGPHEMKCSVIVTEHFV
jgi:hypothetical protein